MRTVLITLITPGRTVDLVVDADTPVAELLPNLLAAGGEEDDASADGETTAAWTVAVMGRQPIASDQTLEAAEVLDGAVLVLRRTAVAGAANLVPQPTTTPAGSPLAQARALLAASGASLTEAVGQAPASRCVTVAVLAPKGGVGKTSVSILLGEMLSALRRGECLVLDGDSDFGSLGRIQPPEFDAATASSDPNIFTRLTQGTVTFAELDRRLWKLAGGLRIVPSPRDASAMAHTDRTAYTRVIGSLQRVADTLIIDCGTGLGQPGVQAAVLASDILVLVSDATPSSAQLTAEAGELLARSRRPILVVVNRTGTQRAETDELQRLDRLFPWAAALVGVPEDSTMAAAITGEMELDSASRRLTTAATELAAILAALWSAGT